MSRCDGLTLIELLAALGVLAVVLVLAVPAWHGWLIEQRLTTETNRLAGTLAYARGEAMRRGERVTLCPSPDGLACADSGDYAQGWLLFVDSAATAQGGDGVERLRVADASRLEAIQGNLPVERYISYTPDGRTRLLSGGFQAGTLTLCDSGRARQLVISATGRVRSQVSAC